MMVCLLLDVVIEYARGLLKSRETAWQPMRLFKDPDTTGRF